MESATVEIQQIQPFVWRIQPQPFLLKETMSLFQASGVTAAG